MLLGEKKFTEQIYYKNVNLSLPILSWSNLAAQAVIGLNSTIHNSSGLERLAIMIYAISEYVCQFQENRLGNDARAMTAVIWSPGEFTIQSRSLCAYLPKTSITKRDFCKYTKKNKVRASN